MSNPTTPTPVITESIRERVETTIVEMALTHKEREEILRGCFVALLAKQHLLMVGPGGTGKSLLVRDLKDRITGTTYFETALDETSDPGQLHGPVDIKAMKEDGKHRRVTTNMLPQAHIAFIDEFFNANGPALHSTMPILNERIFHNNGTPTPAPLWSAFMGTNKLNSDADQAALWDRIHHRFVVKYVSDRENLRSLVQADAARRVSTFSATSKTTITLDELAQAHDEAMQLTVPDVVFNTFLDIKDELLSEGVEVSTRRINEGYAAVLANAWLNGHSRVSVGDLDVLSNMWWTLQDHLDTVRKIILAATNPGENEALALDAEITKLRKSLKDAQKQDIEEQRARIFAMELYKNCREIIANCDKLLEKSVDAGTSTTRIDHAKTRAADFMNELHTEFFGAGAK